MNIKQNTFLLKSSLVGALGGLLFGFDTAVIAGATHGLAATYHLSPQALGFTVSSALWGTVLSALFAGIPGEKLGAREALRVTALLYVISALGCAFAWSWWALIFFRFIGGLAIGASSVLGPVYITEIAPAKFRGRLVGLFQINIVVGILLAYLSNCLIGLQQLGAFEWRWELGVSGLPAVLFLVMLMGIPRSPRWLASKNHLDEARNVLRLIGTQDAEEELQAIVKSFGADKANYREPLFTRKYAGLILLAMSAGMFNQLTGINAILYYLNDIFAQAGFSQISANVQAVMIGVTNLVFTLIAMSIIDRLGRKPLLLIGAVGMATSLFGVAAVFFGHAPNALLIWLLMGFIASFAISQGAVVWVYISEIFPTKVRARGQSLGSASHWIMNALISGIFPVVAASSGGYPFAFFGAMMVLNFVVVYFLYPETKQVTLEELQDNLIGAEKGASLQPARETVGSIGH